MKFLIKVAMSLFNLFSFYFKTVLVFNYDYHDKLLKIFGAKSALYSVAHCSLGCNVPLEL